MRNLKQIQSYNDLKTPNKSEKRGEKAERRPNEVFFYRSFIDAVPTEFDPVPTGVEPVPLEKGNGKWQNIRTTLKGEGFSEWFEIVPCSHPTFAKR